MKTLNEIKDEYARSIGFSDWINLLKHQVTIKAIRRDYEVVMERYAREVAREALKNAAENVDSDLCYRYSSERNAFDYVEQSILDEKNIPI